MDRIKLGLAVLIAVAGVAGFYFLHDSPMVVRVVFLILGLVLSAVVALFTERGKHFFAFSRDSIEEVRKVVWPSRKETLQTAGVVCAFVMAMAFFLWLVDAGLMAIVRSVMDQEI